MEIPTTRKSRRVWCRLSTAHRMPRAATGVAGGASFSAEPSPVAPGVAPTACNGEGSPAESMFVRLQDILDIEVTPLSAACGAEIKGVDLTKELSEGAVRAIKAAWAEHLVLVFRGQSITQEQQLRFASYFGELG